MLVAIAFIGGSYLFGTLPFTAALARMSGVDVSRERDLHLALQRKASNVLASLASFVDAIKGGIPILIEFGFGLPSAVVASSGVAAVAGQMWPPFRNCHGEKGNSIGAAVIITLALIYESYFTLISLIPFAIGFGLRYIGYRQLREPTHPMVLALPIGMLLGFAVAPAASWSSGQAKNITLGLLALFTIITVRRLTAYLKEDLKIGSSTTSILLNRLLFDRSFVEKS